MEDDGHGADAGADGQPQGNGLRDLAERAASLGGTLSAGPRAEGGYALRMALPVQSVGAAAGGEGARMEQAERSAKA